ncbi:MAG: hypothetical protein IJC16_00195 [Rikenellaceae bacterium]|nr:hypothetical protein [Rikenellaceae bacterium]
MSFNSFDILTLYRRLAGHVVDATPLGYHRPIDTEQRVEVDTLSEPIAVWDDRQIEGEGLRRSSLTGSTFMMPLRIGDYLFATDPLISVRESKEIVKTVMPGLDGTVKEIIANGDDLITIRGILINEDNDDYPYEQVAELRALKERNESLKVENKLLNLCFGIDRLVIQTLDIEGVEGMQSMQTFVITAESDQDVELVITEGW